MLSASKCIELRPGRVGPPCTCSSDIFGLHCPQKHGWATPNVARAGAGVGQTVDICPSCLRGCAFMYHNGVRAAQFLGVCHACDYRN